MIGENDIERVKWNPQALRKVERAQPYPVDALPPIIRAAVEDVASFTQAPLALVAGSALSAVSTAVQTRFSVQRNARLSGPASLYVLTVAESGERKSSVDSLFMVAIREWEAKQRRDFPRAMAKYNAEMADWQREDAAIANKLEAGILADKVGTDFDPRFLHAMEMPVEPKLVSILHGDDTPEALAIALSEYPVAAIITAEAGVIFGSHGMGAESVTRNLAQANAMWDGGPIRQNRVKRGSLVVENMRVTMGLAVQPEVLKSFIHKTGGLARGIGFLARFLFSRPESTQGTRFYKIDETDNGALRAFNERVTTLLDQPAEFDEYDRLLPHMVTLDRHAYSVWYHFHDEVEEQLGDGSEFAGISDVASKAAENAARIACCLHVFASDPAVPVAPINQFTMSAACSLMRWYLDEAVRFARDRDLSEEVHNAELLEEWLVKAAKQRNGRPVTVNEVRQRGPGPLRLKRKLDDAIELLENHGRAIVWQPTGTKKRNIIIAPQVYTEWCG